MLGYMCLLLKHQLNYRQLITVEVGSVQCVSVQKQPHRHICSQADQKTWNCCRVCSD